MGGVCGGTGTRTPAEAPARPCWWRVAPELRGSGRSVRGVNETFRELGSGLSVRFSRFLLPRDVFNRTFPGAGGRGGDRAGETAATAPRWPAGHQRRELTACPSRGGGGRGKTREQHRGLGDPAAGPSRGHPGHPRPSSPPMQRHENRVTRGQEVAAAGDAVVLSPVTWTGTAWPQGACVCGGASGRQAAA